MEEDKRAENFSDALFTYLWFTENLITESTAAETVGEMSEFIAEVAKAVVVLSALTVPSFNDTMDEYFLRHEMSRRTVFTFLATYCFQNHAENEDIFAVLLNTCTFVYRLVIYCQHKGFAEFINFASMCWTEIFKSDLRKEFYAKGGWDELERYVNDNCYVPKNKDTDHKAFMTFLDEINYLFPKLKVCEEDEFTAPCSEKMVNFEMSHMLNRANVLTTDSIINQTVNFQNSMHLVSTSICEANITAEEAISAYELLTNFYGQDCAGLNCEQNTSETKSDIIDMAHVYKTLSNFINQGILEVEAATGKIIQPKIIKNANIRHATLCCTNCQHEEQVTIISSDTDRTRVYPTSIVSELVHDENLCRVESSEQLDSQ